MDEARAERRDERTRGRGDERWDEGNSAPTKARARADVGRHTQAGRVGGEGGKEARGNKEEAGSRK